MIQFSLSLVSGVISGIVASILINHYYWNKKPKLLISDHIAKNEHNEYRIKIVNESNFYVTNVFVQVQLVTITVGNGGNILNTINVDIPKSSIKIIYPYDEKDVNSLYAVRLAISKNLEELWRDDDHTYLQLIIHCSNEHNNASKLYEKKFYKKSSCIKFGEFEYGKSIKVV